MITGRMEIAPIRSGDEVVGERPAWIARPGEDITEADVYKAYNPVGQGILWEIAYAFVGASAGGYLGNLIGGESAAWILGIIGALVGFFITGKVQKWASQRTEATLDRIRIIPNHVVNSPQWAELADLTTRLEQLREHLPEGAFLDAETAMQSIIWSAAEVQNADLLRSRLQRTEELYAAALATAEAYEGDTDATAIEDAMQHLRLLTETLSELDAGHQQSEIEEG